MKYLKKFGITAEKRIHKGWEEHQTIMKLKGEKGKEYHSLLAKSHPMGYFYKWQYVFTSDKGSMSLIKLLDYHRIGEHPFEVFCLDEMKKWKDATGNEIEVPSTPAKKQLEDIRRFYKREEAIKFIIEILRVDK